MANLVIVLSPQVASNHTKLLFVVTEVHILCKIHAYMRVTTILSIRMYFHLKIGFQHLDIKAIRKLSYVRVCTVPINLFICLYPPQIKNKLISVLLCQPKKAFVISILGMLLNTNPKLRSRQYTFHSHLPLLHTKVFCPSKFDDKM